MADKLSDLHVSLEPHLVDTLRSLRPLLPHELSVQLAPFVADAYDATDAPSPSTPSIPYTLLLSISKWSRTPEGTAALAAQTPARDPGAYAMVALLAGARTSPNRKFPPHMPRADPGLEAQRDISDRRAIVAVLNAFLSVGCAGAATWWAARHTGWKDEWKVLLALLVSVVVAVSEAGLYIIWESRRTAKKTAAQRRVAAATSRRKKSGTRSSATSD
ncbi:hypothetical protein BV25DRAFT_1870951 [Artomyces pyxidatus]|uniref:Uncharacterized protein n=1 Tax=Artomyces pyxidatus TaxID=48021 RepID=A0ACB8SX12_9AGAM|nr:hypothetical protein BV25DRAFT_1870951 [Artomyces pyxidatus]